MAQTYSTELSPTQLSPAQLPSATSGYGARVHRYRASITLASQASGDTVVLANIPAGQCFAGGELISSVSLGTATVAIGNATTAGKYRAAAVFTATDTPTPFGTAASFAADPSTAQEQVLLTVGTAALPSSGTLVVDLYFSGP
jgi:hypothetical protein